MSFSPSMTVPDTPASMRRKLQELREKRALKEQGLNIFYLDTYLSSLGF